MTSLRRYLFRLWMLCSALWLIFLVIASKGDLTNEQVLFAFFPPMVSLLAGASLTQAWDRVFAVLWLRLPEHVRRGVQRIYLVVTLPWVAWYGYQIYDF